MADKTLTAAAYTTAGSWAGAALPSDGDRALIPSTLGVDVIGGDQGSIDLALLDVSEGFNYRFCSSATPLKGAADLIRVVGSTGFYYECSLDGGTASKVDDCRIQMPSRDTPFELGSETADAGDWDAIEVMRGKGTLKGNIAFGAAAVLRVGYVSSRYDDVNLLISAGADTLPEYHQLGGLCEAQSVITVGHIHGRHTQKTAAMTTAYVYPGGVLNYEHTAGTLIVVYPGGTLNFKTNGGTVKAITNVIAWPGAIIIRDPQLHTYTLKEYP